MESTKVSVRFRGGTTFEGEMYLNPHTRMLVFDNDGGQGVVNAVEIESISFGEESFWARTERILKENNVLATRDDVLQYQEYHANSFPASLKTDEDILEDFIEFVLK